MSSNLRVNNILPSVGTNVAIGTAGGSVTLTGNVTGDITSSGVSTFTTLSATNIVGVSTLGVTTAYINTLSGISTIDASAAVSINQNLVFASGYGIDFSADSNAAGMTGELLDDYEEGTWTPTLNVSYTANDMFARYVKIGRFVHVSLTYNSPLTGLTYVGGLPFSPKHSYAGTWTVKPFGESAVSSTGGAGEYGSTNYWLNTTVTYGAGTSFTFTMTYYTDS